MSFYTHKPMSKVDLDTMCYTFVFLCILAGFGFLAWSNWAAIGTLGRSVIIFGYGLLAFAISVAVIEQTSWWQKRQSRRQEQESGDRTPAF